MYTANIADTVIFRNLGKDPNPRLESLKRAVKEAETEIWVPAAVYHELADTGNADSPPNPYLDTAIEEGWLRVAPPLPGERTKGFSSSDGPVEKARFVADEFLNQQTKYPETNNWQDATLVALAVRLFDENTRIRVITHTADENLAAAPVPVFRRNSGTTISGPDTTTRPRQPRMSFQPWTDLRGMNEPLRNTVPRQFTTPNRSKTKSGSSPNSRSASISWWTASGVRQTEVQSTLDYPYDHSRQQEVSGRIVTATAKALDEAVFVAAMLHSGCETDLHDVMAGAEEIDIDAVSIHIRRVRFAYGVAYEHTIRRTHRGLTDLIPFSPMYLYRYRSNWN